MSMITDYVPGAYVTHDMLHMRAATRQWLLDGIPIINTPSRKISPAVRS